MSAHYGCTVCRRFGTLPDDVTFSPRAVVTCVECGHGVTWYDAAGQPIERPTHADDVIVSMPHDTPPLDVCVYGEHHAVGLRVTGLPSILRVV